jgi:hypothetical protein
VEEDDSENEQEESCGRFELEVDTNLDELVVDMVGIDEIVDAKLETE